MHTLNTIDAAALAEQIVARLTIGIEASGRHVHLSRHDLEALFGAGYQLNRVKELSQPGQFACAERVTLEGPKGSIPNVVILGPERPESQVEISLTDGVALGITPPVRLSGDIAGTPGITLRHGDRVLRLERGLPPASAWRTSRPCACGASPPARRCWRRWRCGCPPNSPPWCISTMTKRMPVDFARATGA